jgi:hypothetical protein
MHINESASGARTANVGIHMAPERGFLVPHRTHPTPSISVAESLASGA